MCFIYLKNSEEVLNVCNEQKLHVCHVCCLSAVVNVFAICQCRTKPMFTDVSLFTSKYVFYTALLVYFYRIQSKCTHIAAASTVSKLFHFPSTPIITCSRNSIIYFNGIFFLSFCSATPNFLTRFTAFIQICYTFNTQCTLASISHLISDYSTQFFLLLFLVICPMRSIVVIMINHIKMCAPIFLVRS